MRKVEFFQAILVFVKENLKKSVNFNAPERYAKSDGLSSGAAKSLKILRRKINYLLIAFKSCCNLSHFMTHGSKTYDQIIY